MFPGVVGGGGVIKTHGDTTVDVKVADEHGIGSGERVGDGGTGGG